MKMIIILQGPGELLQVGRFSVEFSIGQEQLSRFPFEFRFRPEEKAQGQKLQVEQLQEEVLGRTTWRRKKKEQRRVATPRDLRRRGTRV